MNLQVHCEHCDASLYQCGDRGPYETEAPGAVKLWERYDPMQRGQGQITFCDWQCVAAWALAQEPAPAFD